MRNLLLVDYSAFVDGWLCQTERMVEQALGLKHWGWQCTVLSASRDGSAVQSSAEAAFPGRVVHTPFGISPYPPLMDRRGLRALWRSCCATVGMSKLVHAPEAGWTRRLRRWDRMEALCGRNVDVVWAICPGSLLNIAAAAAVAQRLSRPWVIEFRDPCPYPHQRLTRFEERTLLSNLEACTAVVTTTQAYADHLSNRHDCCRGKTMAICSSFDDAWLDRRFDRGSDAGVLTLIHAGSLPGGNLRNALSLTKALTRAAEFEPATKGKIRLRLFGNCAGVQEAADLARALGNPESVTTHKVIPSGEVHEEMARSDVLVVIKHPDPAYVMQIPGKLFQYLPFGKPILGIMESGCEAAEVLRKSGLGVVSGHEQVDLTARQLLDLWRNRERLADVYPANRGYIMQFARSRMAEKLNRQLEATLAAG